jgi:hypothetical protein
VHGAKITRLKKELKSAVRRLNSLKIIDPISCKPGLAGDDFLSAPTLPPLGNAPSRKDHLSKLLILLDSIGGMSSIYNCAVAILVDAAPAVSLSG